MYYLLSFIFLIASLVVIHNDFDKFVILITISSLFGLVASVNQMSNSVEKYVKKNIGENDEEDNE